MNIRQFFSNWIVRNLLLAVLAVAAVVGVSSLLLNIGTQHNREITVPDFTNMSYTEAVRAAGAAGVRVTVADSVYIRRMKPGVVYMQTPKAGDYVKKGRRIRLTTNTMVPKTVPMPALVGASLREAKAELARAGLTLGRLVYVRDIATNNVLRQQRGGVNIAPGTKVASGTAISLVLGLNPEDSQTYIPNVVGKQYLRAVDILQENSLNIGRLVFDSSVKSYADSVSAVVYSQRPADVQTAPMGSEVSLSLTVNPDKMPGSARKR